MILHNEQIEDLRRHYDTTDLSDLVRDAQVETRIVDADEVMVSTSIRLPRSLMQRVRERAAAAGIPATALMRRWVEDRLDADGSEAVVSVSDLRRLIAERSHPAA